MLRRLLRSWRRISAPLKEVPVIRHVIFIYLKIVSLIRASLRFIWYEHIPRIAFLVLSVMVIGALVVLGLERHKNEQFQDMEDALWWAVITVTTTGYGDKYPITPWGRVVTGILIFTEMGLVSVFTATIASALTARRLKEARGLEQITTAGHLLICGWNPNAEGVIQNLVALGAHESGDIVMVNSLPEDQVQEIILRLQDVQLRYVHGDFALEGVLRKANVENAATVVIMADIAGGDRAKADERTILGTLTIKSINRDVKVCAQLLSKDNEQHLRRAGADEIVIVGEFTGFLIASAAQLPGLNSVVRELMVDQAGNSFHRIEIPEEFVGRTYLDLLLHFRREHGATLIGVVSEEKGMTMDEMLTDSAIDTFIRAKFAEAGKESLFQVGGGSQVRVNLPDDYQIGENDHAIVIMQGKAES